MKNPLHKIDLATRRWHWHDVPDAVQRFLEAPENRGKMECVKSTDRRMTCKLGGYYLKIDYRPRLKDLFFPAAKSEYRAARSLAAAGIDTVKHLGWGRSGTTTVLVTQAWHPDAEDVMHYWCRNFVYGEKDPAEFLGELSAWLRQLIAKPLRHGDLHLGNVLYSPEKHDFTLVDLHNVGVSQNAAAQLRNDALHALLDLRSAVSPGRMLELFGKVADLEQDTAAREMHRMLLEDLKLAEHQWERRVRQFLSGYPKFSEIIDWHGSKMLVQRNLLRKNFFDPAAAEVGRYRTIRLDFPAALEMMLFSFWLSLLLIPHVPAAALAADGTLYFPRLDQAGTAEPSREAVNEFNEYLLCFGLNQEDYRSWRCRSGDRLIIASCTGMLTSAGNRQRFQIAADWRLK